jgi:hypothetical protein
MQPGGSDKARLCQRGPSECLHPSDAPRFLRLWDSFWDLSYCDICHSFGREILLFCHV